MGLDVDHFGGEWFWAILGGSGPILAIFGDVNRDLDPGLDLGTYPIF